VTCLYVYLAAGVAWLVIASFCLEPIPGTSVWRKIFTFAFVLFAWPVFWLLIAVDGP
jgi:hypothetical protein